MVVKKQSKHSWNDYIPPNNTSQLCTIQWTSIKNSYRLLYELVFSLIFVKLIGFAITSLMEKTSSSIRTIDFRCFLFIPFIGRFLLFKSTYSDVQTRSTINGMRSNSIFLKNTCETSNYVKIKRLLFMITLRLCRWAQKLDADLIFGEYNMKIYFAKSLHGSSLNGSVTWAWI